MESLGQFFKCEAVNEGPGKKFLHVLATTYIVMAITNVIIASNIYVLGSAAPS